MNRLVRRIAIATASVAVAGGAILGAGGSASAATPGADQHLSSPAANTQAVDVKTDSHQQVPGSNGGQLLGDNNHGYRWDDNGHGYGYGWGDNNQGDRWGDNGQGYRWDDYLGWHRAQDSDGHWYWYGHRQNQDYRWDGLALDRWSDGHWATDIQVREYGADFWYVDQLTSVES